jgi:hypothetical protein
MCFGQTTTAQQSIQPSGFVMGAGQNAYNTVNNLVSGGFSAPLQSIAPFTPSQTSAFSAINNMASAPNANNPFFSSISNDFSRYAAAPASKISAPSVLGSNVDPTTATLNQYVDPNLQLELNPTLAEITRQADVAKTGAGGVGSAATAAGAFGDARQGVENANVDEAAMRQAAQATAGAYQTAFQNASNLRGLDVSNLINTGALNANLNETALQRVLGSGSALQNLAGFQTGQGINLAQTELAAGTQQQQNAQQSANAIYNQALQNTLAPYQYQIPALTSTLSALTPTQPSTTSVQQPNNAGWNILGSVLGAGASGIGTSVGQGIGISSIAPLLLSDERLKLDMEPIGETADGLPIYSYRYVREIDPTGTPRIGLSAQDVEKVYPEAVIDLGGVKAIDYAKATAFARLLGSQFAGDYAEAA